MAGHVAQTGETLNVADAYQDERFNKAIDEQVNSFFIFISFARTIGAEWGNLKLNGTYPMLQIVV